MFPTWPGSGWALVTWLVFTALLLTVTVTDLRYRLIPNRFLVAALLLGVPCRLAAYPKEWPEALAGGVGAFLAFSLLALLSSGGLGGGDVKLAGVIGWFLGWEQTWAALLLGLLAAAFYGLLLVTTRRKGWRETIPLGPFLAFGAFLASLWGETLLAWYRGV